MSFWKFSVQKVWKLVFIYLEMCIFHAFWTLNLQSLKFGWVRFYDFCLARNYLIPGLTRPQITFKQPISNFCKFLNFLSIWGFFSSSCLVSTMVMSQLAASELKQNLLEKKTLYKLPYSLSFVSKELPNLIFF